MVLVSDGVSINSNNGLCVRYLCCFFMLLLLMIMVVMMMMHSCASFWYYSHMDNTLNENKKNYPMKLHFVICSIFFGWFLWMNTHTHCVCTRCSPSIYFTQFSVLYTHSFKHTRTSVYVGHYVSSSIYWFYFFY